MAEIETPMILSEADAQNRHELVAYRAAEEISQTLLRASRDCCLASALSGAVSAIVNLAALKQGGITLTKECVAQLIKRLDDEALILRIRQTAQAASADETKAPN